ncbi:MAG: sigma 54-interacting transcriptional regulator [Candidatus Zixiibacteriota bacterium]|nr:MAG: sigma 54-interacting transcriptional regulator [candidate division Zixibacteria bacterium]
MNRLAEAEKLLGMKKSAEALQVLRAIDTSQLNTRDRSVHDILLAEAGMLLNDYSLVSGLDSAIETFRFDADTAKFARAKYLQGWLLLVHGKYAQAQEVLLEAHSNYLRCQELEGAARALNRRAQVSLRLGDSDDAVELLLRSRDIYQRLGNHLQHANVSANLAYLYCLTGRLKDSQTEYGYKECILREYSPRSKMSYWLGISLVHALKGDTSTARAQLDQCIPHLDKYAYEKALYHEFSGWISCLENDLAAGEASLSESIRLHRAPGIPIGSDSVRPERLLAQIYADNGRWRLAQKHGEQVFQLASASNDRAEIAGCYRIFAQIDYHKNKPDSARTWYDRALDLYSLIKYRYELAVTQFLAAQTNLYTEPECAVMLARSRDYFASEDIPSYKKRVDEEIRRLRRTSAVTATPHTDPIDAGGRSIECPDIITRSSKVTALLTLARRVAPSEMNVLVTGETGTGKDLMAKYIHYHSRRAGRFISVNAAAVPDSMVESELFGYVKGAFTGADRDKPGLFEAADGGTFFLDEIADASSAFQAKLLEVIESRCIRRLGDTSVRPANFKLIAATNQVLDSHIQQNRFRADLYHRLNEFLIHLPPLRERQEDFLPLTEYFLRTSGLDSRTNGNRRHIENLSDTLSRRNWPGNIRQLRAEINYLVLVSDRNVRRMVKEAEKFDRHAEDYRKLTKAIEDAGGNQSLAARRLGIPESTLRYRLAKYRKKSKK